MTIEQIQKLATQARHLDIIEENLFDAQVQLKKMREEYEELMQDIIKDNREPVEVDK